MSPRYGLVLVKIRTSCQEDIGRYWKILESVYAFYAFLKYLYINGFNVNSLVSIKLEAG